MWFHLQGGVLTCRRCAEKQPPDTAPVGGNVLAAMRHILYSPLDKAFSFSMTADGLESPGRTPRRRFCWHSLAGAFTRWIFTIPSQNNGVKKIPMTFTEQIYALVRRIPAGRVATYGLIAYGPAGPARPGRWEPP